MIEFILDILFNYPEGISFAILGLRKKRKKAEKLINSFEDKLDGIDSINTDVATEDLPKFSEKSVNIERLNRITGAPGTDYYKPEFPYRGRQIIIDSGRVLLNAKDDSVFILGDKAVGISTNGTFNIDSGGKTIINSPEIDLGLEATESVVLGNQLVLILNEFLQGLELVAKPLKLATDKDKTKIAFANSAGEQLSASVKLLNDRLDLILSQTVKVQK